MGIGAIAGTSAVSRTAQSSRCAEGPNRHPSDFSSFCFVVRTNPEPDRPGPRADHAIQVAARRANVPDMPARTQPAVTTASTTAQSAHPSTTSTSVADSPGWLKYTKDAASTIQSIATIAALLVGAWWVLRRRRTYPRANFTHLVTHVPLNDEVNLVRLSVEIENIGDVLLKLEKSAVGIQQVMPVPDPILPALAARASLVGSTESEIKWPFIDARWPEWSGSCIEPGESAAFDVELFVPTTVHWILVYSYFRNITRPGDQGWNTSTLYEIKPVATAVV